MIQQLNLRIKDAFLNELTISGIPEQDDIVFYLIKNENPEWIFLVSEEPAMIMFVNLETGLGLFNPEGNYPPVWMLNPGFGAKKVKYNKDFIDHLKKIVKGGDQP